LDAGLLLLLVGLLLVVLLSIGFWFVIVVIGWIVGRFLLLSIKIVLII
jgi:hypothetical protein